MESTTNPTEITQQNPLQILESSFSEIFTAQVQVPAVDIQEQFCEGLRLQPQRRIEAANQLLRKRERESN